jgi:nifR3 family TIM-barrel protein
MLKIGSIEIPSNLILAPLAGISDMPFRLLNRRFGCEFAFVEMINVRSLGHKSKRTQQMLASLLPDRPLGIQILGSQQQYVARALDILQPYDFDVLDFNAACPVRKVTQRGEGAALLKDPKKLRTLLGFVVKHSRCPVTVKIRTGWDSGSVNACETAAACEDAGVKAIFIHGRTKVQGYCGNVDYEQIRKVKRAVRVPVVASGNILNAQLAKKMCDETGCDGLLVARGALGNPWIFQQISHYLLRQEELADPDSAGVAEVMTRHLDECIGVYGERIAIIKFRKFFSWYTKGLRHARLLRERSSAVKTHNGMRELIAQVVSMP